MPSPDVIIIGAGVYGLATAWFLGKSGRRVVVIDRGEIGGEASGYALGRIDPVIGGSGSSHTVGGDDEASHGFRKPPAQADLGEEGYRDHLALREEIQSLSGIDYEMEKPDTLQLCCTEEERRFAKRIAPHWTIQGFNSQLVEPDEITRIDPRITPAKWGGLLVQGPFFLDSLKFSQAIAACARSVGIEFKQASVKSVGVHVRGVQVTTDDQSWTADALVIAAGPWTGELADAIGSSIPVTPSKGEILRMEPPSGPRLPVHLHGPCSVVHKQDGMMWVAATATDEGFDRSPTAWARQELLNNGSAMFPALRDSKVRKHTVCFRPATPDGMPIVGQLPGHDRVWVATGGGGSGVMQCLAVGRATAEMLAQTRTRVPFPGTEPDRFLPG